uniref:Tc1-like transposase DDE domain-containing protein n=1 Tax=Oncorhynchus tshawytscha TaxID=74940 RepID=A0AAZ3QHJ5_ONCTS
MCGSHREAWRRRCGGALLANDLKHTSRLCKGYLTKVSDRVLHQMTWPPQSPSLNPIEMVWDELDCRVKEKQPTSAQHVWELLQDYWKSKSRTKRLLSSFYPQAIRLLNY